MSTALRRGLAVPGDYSITGFGNLHFASRLPVPLTTVAQPTHAIGRAATEELFAHIKGKRTSLGNAQAMAAHDAEVVRGICVALRDGQPGSRWLLPRIRDAKGREIIYPELEQALVIHARTIEVSGGGLIGNRNPDWGILRWNERQRLKLELVRETNGAENMARLQHPDERRKTECARGHFAALGVSCRPVRGDNPCWWEEEDRFKPPEKPLASPAPAASDPLLPVEGLPQVRRAGQLRFA